LYVSLFTAIEQTLQHNKHHTDTATHCVAVSLWCLLCRTDTTTQYTYCQHCNTDTATHCNRTHPAIHFEHYNTLNTLQHTATSTATEHTLPFTFYNCLPMQNVRSRHIKQSCRCNTLQHTATHCNTLQPTATHCNTLHIKKSCRCNTLQHRHCNPLQPTATHCNPLQPTATRCNPLQHGHGNTLQRTATHCNTVFKTTYLCGRTAAAI